MSITLHQGDLPADIKFGDVVAVDAEMMGLNAARDRLCLVQLSSGDGTAHLVKFSPDGYDAPNLKKLLTDKNVIKIFHFGRMDILFFKRYLDVLTAPVYCTKIASRIARTFAPRHGLRDLCRDLIGVEISKQQQCSDWGADELTPEQLEYAAADVFHLHKLREALNTMLIREGRMELAQGCFDFLPHRALLDMGGFADEDLFAHI